MNDERSGVTRVQLPAGAADFDFDDSDVPIDYDEEHADELVDAARLYQTQHPELVPGRPSLTSPGTHSPHVSFRVPTEMAERLDEQSATEGVSRSALARRALAAYLAATRQAS